jgi:uncharacterized membrane protein YphA (DoxX/SURF4 family)
MTRKVTYWVSTSLLAALSVFAAFAYLSGSPQAVHGFAHVGYPQQLRVILGIAKLLGAIVLVVPGLAKVKEWAYAGFTFAWISAFVAHYLAKDGPKAFMPVVLLLILVISYLTRPASRQCHAKVTSAQLSLKRIFPKRFPGQEATRGRRCTCSRWEAGEVPWSRCLEA